MNSVIRISSIFAGVLIFAAAGPVSAEEEAAPEQAAEVEYPEQIKAELAERGLRPGERVSRIPHISISGWDRLDDQHLLLTVRVSKKYLMRLAPRCEALNDNATLQFSTVGSDVTEQDHVRVSNDGFDRGICNIAEIRKLEKVEAGEAGE